MLGKFERDVKADHRIDLVREGDMSWFLSTRYSYDFRTGLITADQEAYIDTLAANHGLTDAHPCTLPMKPSVDLAQIPALALRSKVLPFLPLTHSPRYSTFSSCSKTTK